MFRFVVALFCFVSLSSLSQPMVGEVEKSTPDAPQVLGFYDPPEVKGACGEAVVDQYQNLRRRHPALFRNDETSLEPLLFFGPWGQGRAREFLRTAYFTHFPCRYWGVVEIQVHDTEVDVLMDLHDIDDGTISDEEFAELRPRYSSIDELSKALLALAQARQEAPIKERLALLERAAERARRTSGLPLTYEVSTLTKMFPGSYGRIKLRGLPLNVATADFLKEIYLSQHGRLGE